MNKFSIHYLPRASAFTSWRKDDKRKRILLFVVSIAWFCLQLAAGAWIYQGNPWGYVAALLGWLTFIAVYLSIEMEIRRMAVDWGQTTFHLNLCQRLVKEHEKEIAHLKKQLHAPISGSGTLVDSMLADRTVSDPIPE